MARITSNTIDGSYHLVLAICTNSRILVLICQHAGAAGTATFHCAFGGAAGGSLTVDTKRGNYSVDIEGAPTLPQLIGAPPQILQDGAWLAANDGLDHVSAEPVSGADGNGDYVGVSVLWTIKGGDHTKWSWETSFRCYAAGSLVFRQAFAHGSNDTLASASLRHRDQPSSAFPSFQTAGWPQSLRLATFCGQNAARTTQLGTFAEAYSGGYMSGPLALFGPSLDGVVVLSPLSNFMVAEHNINSTTAQLQFGLQGMLASVPADYATEFVLSAHIAPRMEDAGTSMFVEHAGTVAGAFMRWGDSLLRAHNGAETQQAVCVE